MDFPLKTIDPVGNWRDQSGRLVQANLKLGPTEWQQLIALCEQYGFSRNGMARRVFCAGLRSLNKA